MSKVFILSTLPVERVPREVTRVAICSSVIALGILVVLTAAGKLIISYIFHVELYSLRIAGGMVLLLLGLKALSKGIFFRFRMSKSSPIFL